MQWLAGGPPAGSVTVTRSLQVTPESDSDSTELSDPPRRTSGIAVTSVSDARIVLIYMWSFLNPKCKAM